MSARMKRTLLGWVLAGAWLGCFLQLCDDGLELTLWQFCYRKLIFALGMIGVMIAWDELRKRGKI